MTKTGRRAPAAACTVALLALYLAGPAGAAPVPNTTERVTVGPGAAELAQGGEVAALSADGCLALTREWSGAIVPADDNEAMDAFVRDCETGSLDHVSVDPDGEVFPAGVQAATMSGDGRYVALVSQESPWTAGGYLYVHDRATHTTEHVPVEWSSGGALLLEDAAIDPTGRWVAVTFAGTLVLVDLQDGSSEHVQGTQGVDLAAFASQVSSGGDVVFTSGESLVSEDINTNQDPYLYDRSSETIALLGKRPSGETTVFGAVPAISANGRYAVFHGSFEAEGPAGAWLVDRQEGTLSRADRTHDETAPDGWVSSTAVSDTCDVAYDTDASNILPTDTNPGTNGYDTFVWDCATDETTLVGVSTGAVQGDGFNGTPVITPDGRHVGFLSDAANLVAGDTNDAWDGFVRHLPADAG